MVHDTVREIFFASFRKLFGRACVFVLAQIVKLQDLVQVRQVIFTNIISVIFDHVFEFGNRPVPIKRPALVGKEYEENSTLFQYALPFRKCFQRIRHVLKTVRRDNAIICRAFNLFQVRTFGDELRAYGFLRMVLEAVNHFSRPDSLCRELAIIYSRKNFIDRKGARIRKGGRWTADFQGMAIRKFASVGIHA